MTKLGTIVDMLARDLMHIGFGKVKINIIINDEFSKKFEEDIKRSLEEIKIEDKKPEPVKETKKFIRRGKTEEGCILGKHIEGHIDSISTIQDEEDSVTIEATPFGIEVVETKNGFKIATIKVTDYTDSITMKMFARTDEEFEKIKKISKM